MPRADAFEWRDLWARADQRGYEAMQAEQAAAAAELFQSPDWRGAAQYRAGAFDASAATLASIESAEGQYNRGNALAKAGRLQEAIGAYDRVLEIDPEHEDARYNRDLLEKYLEDNPEQQQQQQQQNQDQNGDQNPSQQGDSAQADGSGEQQDGQPSADQQNDQQQNGQSQAKNDGSEDSQHDGEPQDDSSAEGDKPEQQAADQDSAANATGPDDVEQWASEQAAEQWLRRVPQDPGGLLRRKFLYQYQRLGVDQDGKSVLDGAERRPW
jgi:Ca-activated chloride channel family protein